MYFVEKYYKMIKTSLTMTTFFIEISVTLYLKGCT